MKWAGAFRPLIGKIQVIGNSFGRIQVGDASYKQDSPVQASPQRSPTRQRLHISSTAKSNVVKLLLKQTALAAVCQLILLA